MSPETSAAKETSTPGGVQWPRSALPSAEETDEEVLWNGTESEDDSEVALLQMLDISSDLDDESWIATASPRQTSKRFK